MTTIPGILIPLDCLPAVWEVFQGAYDIPNCQPDYIIDIGANVGLFAIWAKEKWPLSKVYCFEPNPELFPYLQNNASFAENRNAGIGDPTITELFTASNRLCSSQYDLGRQYIDRKTIPITIHHPEIFDFKENTLLKIDAEGAEVYICENLHSFPKWLVVECHSRARFDAVRKSLSKGMKMVQIMPLHDDCYLAKFEKV
jgi:FkbM family methyltransferase